MKYLTLSFSLVSGALQGALVAALVAFFGLSIIGLLFGYGGPLLALYYAAYILLYVAPLGLVIGAIVTAIRLVRNPPEKDVYEDRNWGQYTKLAFAVWIGIPLIIMVGIAAIPYVATNVNKNVRHGAKWTTENSPDCVTPTVIVMLVEYANYEIVCSTELLNYLQDFSSEIVPVTYRVTYNFGEPGSYQLIQVGEIDISWEEWIRGPSGCGGEYHPPCDSQQAKNGSPLYESSWSG